MNSRIADEIGGTDVITKPFDRLENPIEYLRHAFACHRPTFLAGQVLLALLVIAMLITYDYSIFSHASGESSQAHIIEVDEAVAVVGLLCLGLLALSWHFILSLRREVRTRIKAERRACELALRDPLTGLLNCRQFECDLKAAIAAPPRGAHAVLMLDLNNFKDVNDAYGHAVGDEVLTDVAERLRRAVRHGDLVVRFGGDEFVILARHLTDAEEATSIALRVIEKIEQPITIGSTSHRIEVAIGIALIPQDGNDEMEIMRKVDIAMYRAKAEPGSAFRYFEVEMDSRAFERGLIERDLRTAISNGAARSDFQPLIDLRTKRVVGFEALARWTHPTLGEVPPDRFIPIAESCGLLNELSDQLLRQAACAAYQWPQDVSLSFNISPAQLKDPTLGLRVLSILAETGLSPHRVEIEITEGALVEDFEGAQCILGGLRHAGVRIALDDFGTGYSSLYHLRNLRIDKIKIDRRFIDNMENEPEASKLVCALLGFGHGLGLTVTAEGVEQLAQETTLLEQGCEQAQGYLYGHAMLAADTINFIAAHNLNATASGRHAA